MGRALPRRRHEVAVSDARISSFYTTLFGMVQILDDSSGAAGAAATHEFSIRRARTVNTFPDAK